MEIILLVAACIIILILFLWLVPIGIWFQALVSGTHTSLIQLIFMRFRKVPPTVIVSNMISATKAGLKLSQNELEAHYLAGGRVNAVVNALISADKANMNLDFKTATAIDLAGRDVLAAVKEGRSPVRVGEGIVTSIGSAVSHKQVLENPDSISKLVLEKGLDSGTAFEILSIDIADIDVGKNIGAQLQMDQANADKNIAQAKAEERRAMAVAQEQEMKAKAQEARAKVIEAEAEVPLAMADAFRNGNLGIMDYYRMKNIQADTDMRESISKPAATQQPKK